MGKRGFIWFGYKGGQSNFSKKGNVLFAFIHICKYPGNLMAPIFTSIDICKEKLVFIKKLQFSLDILIGKA